VNASTMSVLTEGHAAQRQVPWRRMAWVTWRQHRVALAGAATLLGGLAVYTLIAGFQMHHAYAVAAVCHPASSPTCGNLFLSVNQMNPVLAGGYVLLAVPALIGAFAGAPVLAREMETGTFRYAWTQGFGRWRWALAKLTTVAVVLAAAAEALSALFSWYYQPYFAARSPALAFTEMSPMNPGLFGPRGLTFAAWTLAAVTMGGLAGMLIRRIVPAIAATLAVYAGLAVATGMFLRQHYLAPLVTSRLNVPYTAWITTQWLAKDGTRSPAHGNQAIRLFQQLCPSSALGEPGSTGKMPLSPVQCFIQHGYTQWTAYQPATRFWPFQWIEVGWLLALSLLLIGSTVWLVQRRAS